MLLSIALLLNSFLPTPNADTSSYDLLVGSYTKEGNPGIEIFGVDARSGKTVTDYTLSSPNASYLTLTKDRKNLYAVREEGGGSASVVAFQSGFDGKYNVLNSVVNPGNGPCFIAYREESKTIYTANYGSGSLCVFKTENGKKNDWNGIDCCNKFDWLQC